MKCISNFIEVFNGVLAQNQLKNDNLNINEIVEQAEIFFEEHPTTFDVDEEKIKLIGWPDLVYIDLIHRECDKVKEKPEKLFDITNLIIKLDKIQFLKNNNTEHTRHFKRNKNQGKSNILSANFTPDYTSPVTTSFIRRSGYKKINIKLLIGSGSMRSYIFKNFAKANKIPISNLPSPINIKLPNDKNINITQSTKQVTLSCMNHAESFEFCIANLHLQGISGILGRDWLSDKYLFHSTDMTETLISDNEPKEGNDSIEDICATILPKNKDEFDNNQSIIKKFYADFSSVFEEKEANKIPHHRPYDISIDVIPGGQLYYGSIYSLTNEEINSYPIPRINGLMNSFKDSKIFTRLDLKSAYNL
ncbi:hypothetical protein PIROE2DRAFT_1216 [Piromyces sp. E2]|nr:hypothetical protein PIROE2DRAFT_1216 [Piromyces sp. E2]|eukprot:OUM70675.1 hypothetical protein PIROE2DRAFT_1216 [Piromyces sp. E2]